jgi:formate dehydrogenase subunit gamma
MSTNTATAPVVRLLRFDAVQRFVHWINALLFGVLMFTGIPLYFGSFFGVLFPRHVIQEIHLWSGIFLPLPIVVSLFGPWGHRMRQDLHRCSYWTMSEWRWLRTFGRESLNFDKFNPGQKANALFVGAGIIIMWATGYILQWFRYFSVSWREGATATHDFFAFAFFVIVAGHIVMALSHREAMVSMLNGTVSEEWAEKNAKEWADEESPAK